MSEATAEQWETAMERYIRGLKFQEDELQRKYEDAKLEKDRTQKIRMDLEHYLYKEKLTK